MSRRSTPEHRDPQLRKWPVFKILDKRYTDEGVIELLADWEPTIVRSSHISRDENDLVWVRWEQHRIDGVRRHFGSGVDPESGEELSTVEWKPSWRSVWALAGALDVIADYHDQHPEDVRKKEGEWWRRTDLGPFIHEAEGEAGPGSELHLAGHYLVPRKGDYTLTVAAQFFGELDGYASTASVRYLNMPLRQKLIFSDAYIEAMTSANKKGINLRTNLRLMLVYVTGLARSMDMCSRCAEGKGPFAKCVIDDSVAMGICVNCAISVSKSSTCQFWHHNRRAQRPSVWNPAGWVSAEEELRRDDEDSGDSGINGGGVDAGSSGQNVDAGKFQQNVDFGNSEQNVDAGKFQQNVDFGNSEQNVDAGKFQQNVNSGNSAQNIDADDGDHGSESVNGKRDSSSGLFVTPAPSSCAKLESAALSKAARRSRSSERAEQPSRYATPATRSAAKEEPAIKLAKDREVRLKRERPLSLHGTNGLGPSKGRRLRPQMCGISRVRTHETCTSPHFGRPCCDDRVGGSRAGSQQPVLVHRGRTFEHGEATAAEVDDILSHCPCDHAEEFQNMYQVYIESLSGHGSDEPVLSKAECLSKIWYRELNQAVNLFCPAPGQMRADVPQCIEVD